MKMIFSAIILSVAVFFNAGCGGGEPIVLSGVNKTKAVEVRGLIEAELRVGSTSDDIEIFFEKHDIGYSYIRFDERYHGIIRDVSESKEVDQAVTINIYVDKNKSFKSSEVDDSFTAI